MKQACKKCPEIIRRMEKLLHEKGKKKKKDFFFFIVTEGELEWL